MSEPGVPRPAHRFTWQEFSGSLGDLGMFLPLVVAMTTACRLDLGIVLVAAGAMNILTGWTFRQPIPVQPMKAVAAVAITEGLTGGELQATGLLLGALLVAIAFVGVIDLVVRAVPPALVRGIQLGIGLKLAAKGAEWVFDLPLLGWDSVLVAVVAVAALLLCVRHAFPGLLVVFVAGFLLLWAETPDVFGSSGLALPALNITWPGSDAWGPGLVKGALPQLPLTLLNSVIAVCALSSAYFPGRGVPPRHMTASVGVMNLVCAPIGAIPMCHGSGGLAAQYGFGARTGGSVIMLGGVKIAAGLAFGSMLLPILDAYPQSILGTMLAFAGVELAATIRDVKERDALTVTLVMAACILGANTWIGFLVGCVLYAGLHWAARRRAD